MLRKVKEMCELGELQNLLETTSTDEQEEKPKPTSAGRLRRPHQI